VSLLIYLAIAVFAYLVINELRELGDELARIREMLKRIEKRFEER